MKKKLLFFLLCFQCFTVCGAEETVVCIHGFLTTQLSMRPVQQSLKCFGFRACSWDYPSRKRTIEEHACHLVNYLQEIACWHPGETINFVTHSTGALILRAALNRPECPEEAKVGRAALLSPPNQGTSLGHRFRNFWPLKTLMGNKSGWQLLNWNTCDIRDLGSYPSSMQVLVIAGTCGNKIFFKEPNDGFLTIDETALETPYYWTSFAYSHGELISAKPVLCCLRKFLYWGYPVPGNCGEGEIQILNME
ncbi:MAG: hypothetical protein S4CHLAM2_01810 [Chlamydiales bacterium]|nr:hypothetical protein [Chlamydiales bacterium]